MVKALDVGNGSCKSSSVDAKKSKRPSKASGSKDVTKPAEGLSRGNDNINVESAQAEVLYENFVS